MAPTQRSTVPLASPPRESPVAEFVNAILILGALILADANGAPAAYTDLHAENPDVATALYWTGLVDPSPKRKCMSLKGFGIGKLVYNAGGTHPGRTPRPYRQL